MTTLLQITGRSIKIRKLTEAGRALTCARSVDDVLQLTVECAADLLSADTAIVMLTDEHGLFSVAAARGLDASSVRQRRSIAPGQVGQRLDELFAGSRGRVLGVPLVTGAVVTGVLAAAAVDGENVKDFEWLLLTLADQAAVAIEKIHPDETAHDEEHPFRLAVESTGVGTWDYAPGTGRLVWDARCKALFNARPDAPDRYEALLEAVHPDDRQLVHGEIQRSLRGGATESFRLECRPASADGDERWLMANGRSLLNQLGKPIRVVGTVLDVTDGKRREAELRANEERFRRLSVELEQANRAKDQFLMTLSHELRTPLTAIGGWVRLLQSAKLSPEQAARALDVISRSVKTQTHIVDDLLDVSRIATGELRVHPIWCDGTAVIDAAIDAVRPAADAKAIRIDTDVATGGATIFADPQRLQQVLWHVLSNAVKFTGRCGHITVSCARAEGELQIVVSDNGEGIAPQFLPFVFDRLSQAEASPRHEQGGQGVGLAIVRHLVSLHGGSASVHSDGKGLGTTLTMRLPLPDASQEPTHQRPATPVRRPA